MTGVRTSYNGPVSAAVICCLFAWAWPSTCLSAASSSEREDGEIDESSAAWLRGSLDGWDEEYDRIEQVINQTWELNDWGDESDLFARDLVLDVAEVPPWEYVGRLQVLSDRISERYDFTPLESIRFQSMVVRELGGFMSNNSKTLTKQAKEWAKSRASGQPVTPEQIARWTKESELLIREANRRILRMGDKLAGTMDPERRALLAADLEGYGKRIAYLKERRAAWERGEWRPDEWGLEGDSAQDTMAATIIWDVDEDTNWVSYDPSTWHAYVRHFEKAYGLDRSQKGAARSIYAEVLKRAGTFVRLHAEELTPVLDEDRATHPAYAAIRGLFEELGFRLDALLTCTQRVQIEP